MFVVNGRIQLIDKSATTSSLQALKSGISGERVPSEITESEGGNRG